MAETVRTRIAPSPTGNLHVGTARTALFSELFARHHGGQFIVRSEDTDTARSLPEYEVNILEGLAWLGLTWDEGPDKGGPVGPYRQSERTDMYRTAIQHLLDTGQAYAAGEGDAIKLKVAATPITFTDLVRGDVTIHPDTWGGDFVIARSLDSPVFHLAVVIDDATMNITHVIRGDDHVSNTARHILLQRALGYTTPQYAHVPLLLDTQRRKLSKRAGETSLLAYRDAGYLPAALLNFLSLLGWSPKTDQEFFTHDELIAAFSLEGVQKAGAVFSVEKLNAVNKHYLRQLPLDELVAQATPFLAAAGIVVDDNDYWARALATEQPRVSTLAELPAAVAIFAPSWQPEYPGERLIWKKSDAATTKKLLEQTHQRLSDLAETDFTPPTLETNLLSWIDEHQLGRGDTLWPLRVALTGREHSPGPFEVAAILGKSQTLARITHALAKL